jgi:peroxiredoxin Q/BCP
MVEEGSPAPDFALQSDTGETVRLSDLSGSPVVLYFYPRDQTSGHLHSKTYRLQT